jgi:aminoglycoside/choline kinase family phosphotransferase
MELFLTLSGWGQARRSTLAGDASNRRYDRLIHPELGRAVLMDAPPEKGEDIRPFITIATHLRSAGLSAPQVLARDEAHGFLILEDLGDDLFARVLTQDLSHEAQLYDAAIDALIVAQNHAAPKGLAQYGADEMAQTAMLAPDWYLAQTQPVSDAQRGAFHDMVHGLLDHHLTAPFVLVQRDYHAENLLWLPERDGVARVGLLDFQDAMRGPAAYDVASLLKDARRDVSPAIQEAALTRYITRSGVAEDAFRASYALCSAQRNLRIIGVFARLCIRDSKPQYPDLMPRVWANLQSDLAHPALADLKAWVDAHMPPPTPAIIAQIKAAHV